jgi:uncharacterized protein DUF6527
VKLTELDPQFVRWEDQPYTGDMVLKEWMADTDTEEGWKRYTAAGCPTERRTEMRERQIEVHTMAEAQGIRMRCPVCRDHGLAVAFAGRGVLDHHGSHDRNGNPSRWQVSGSGFHDLTLHPSVDLTGPQRPGCWHGWIKNGEVT